MKYNTATYQELLWFQRYSHQKDNETEEADKVSANITKLLNERSFAFAILGLTAIHWWIFNGVFKFAGQIRDYNIAPKKNDSFASIRYTKLHG